MKKALRIAALVAVGALSAGCASASHPGPAAPRPVVLTSRQVAALRTYGAADSAFGLGLLGAVCAEQPGGNVLLSPVSVATGLGLAFLGARGETATVMARAMHLPAAAPASLIAGLQARSALLGSLARPGVTFAQSNRIWTDPALLPKPAYVSALAAAYGARLTKVPLLTDPAQAERTINAAVAAQTHGHITNLLPPGSLTGQIAWMLTNALYLHADWAQPFNPALTAPGSFATDRGPVQASYLSGGSFTTASYAGWTGASLSYRGDRLRMLALLPPAAGRSGCELPEPALLGRLTSRLATSSDRTAIALPKVNLAWSGSLRAPLTALGMGQVFTSAADFSGISDQACCIGLVQHAATLTVTAKGTVASAATAVGVEPTAAAPELPRLRFDRPYLLVLEDSLTSEPLMLAWVANPVTS
jgi:serpin B